MMNELILSKVLFELDPARTCCKENDCFDEYDSIASKILSTRINFSTFYNAIDINFINYFDINLTPQMINNIIDEYNKR